MKKIELLAPAGSLEILKAAVDNGADAVYIGTDLFNARINAMNFTMDELEEGCSYAHRRNSLVYLTLNTLIYNSEKDQALEVAVEAYNRGIDGILVQDIGLASDLHKKYPSIPLHASTQMNISSPDDFKMLSGLGIKRVVLPRELSLEEIGRRVRIARRAGIEVEVFAHGAVCVCYSGLCLYSAMNKSGTRSGNRGLCAQPCRREYSLFVPDSKEALKKGHLLSPKDRSTVPFIADLISLGVSSLKIEGRMRDISYVESAVRAYRRLIDAYYDGGLNDELQSSVENSLLVSFNRGGSFTSQYLTSVKSSDFLSGEYVGKYGLKIGRITSRDPKKGTFTVSMTASSVMPSKGDYISVRDRNREICSFPVGKVHEMNRACVLKGLHPDMISKLEDGYPVFLMSHDFKGSDFKVRKTPVDISVFTDDEGQLVINALINEGNLKGVFSEIKEPLDPGFEGNALNPERIIAQLSKMGNTPFEAVNVYVPEDISIKCPVSFINDMRRRLVEDLISEVEDKTSHYASEEYDMFGTDNAVDLSDEGSVTVMHYFPSLKSVRGDLNRDADIYAFSIYDLMIKSFRERIIDFVSRAGKRFVIVMPDSCHDKTRNDARNMIAELKEEHDDLIYGVMDSDIMSDSSYLKELGLKHYLSAGANIFNSNALRFAQSVSDGSAISYELSEDELSEVVRETDPKKDFEIIVHAGGDIPWMQSDFCPAGAHKEKCRTCFDKPHFILEDLNKEAECKLVCHPKDCSSVIYGPSKYTVSYSVSSLLAQKGYNITMLYTEI
ncbi:MAG: U32 family peptidase [Clostridiales bacterium]|nr:U32 family peptidase [Clostridiales bacterium]